MRVKSIFNSGQSNSRDDFSMIFYSHILLLLLCIIGDAIVPNHIPSGVESLDTNLEKSLIAHFTNLFSKWDSTHYLNIARHGYTREYQYAFFPIYPLLLSLFSVVGMNLKILFGIALNIILHYGAFISLRKLVNLSMIPDQDIDSLLPLFAFNPALIFFVSIYTESLFCYLSWTGFALLFVDKSARGCFFLMIASLTRSNGIFNSVPLIVQLLIELFKSFKVKDSIFDAVRNSLVWLYAGGIASVVLPSLVWQYHMHNAVCSMNLKEDMSQLPCTDYEKSSFIDALSSALTAYPYLQQKYWQVGFLQQYQWKQIPNFIIGFPALFYCLHGIYTCLYNFKKVQNFLVILPWLIHAGVTFLVCLFFAHFQVSTRVIFSSCPFIYIVLLQHINGIKSIQSYYVIYATVYILVGSILHTNHYPWT